MTQTERASEHVRQQVLNGHLQAGTRLSPAALARRLGMSHIPVREAIAELHAEGLVEYRPHRGAFVKAPERGELLDLLELRTLLECHAAAGAARRITDGETDKLERCYHEMQAITRATERADPPATQALLAQWTLADLAFHVLIWEADGNRYLTKVVADTQMISRMFGYATGGPDDWQDLPRFFQENLEVHRLVFEAIRARKIAAARRAMLAHMQRSRRNLLQRLQWREQHEEKAAGQVREFPASVRRLTRLIEETFAAESPPSGRKRAL